MLLKELNVHRTNRPQDLAKRVFIKDPARSKLLRQVADIRGSNLTGVIDDALGLWIEAHHCSWDWVSRAHVTPPRKRSKQSDWIVWCAATDRQARIIGEVVPIYDHLNILFRRAIDAHLMRYDLFDLDGVVVVPSSTLLVPSEVDSRKWLDRAKKRSRR